jgi:hypothetical protein
MSNIKKQEKFGFTVKGGEHSGFYGPFDTKEAANKTRSLLIAGGLTVSDVEVHWTVSTARSIAVAVAPKKEAPKAEAPKAETPKVPAPKRTRTRKATTNA